VQFLTLFCGLLIDRINAVSTVESDAADAADIDAIGVLIVGINCVTMVWPMVRKVIVGKHIEYYEKIMWVLGCPRRCYMSCCGGEKRAAEQRQREVKARATSRRAAGVQRDGSIDAMPSAGTPSDTKAKNQVLSSLGMDLAGLQQQDVETGMVPLSFQEVDFSVSPARERNSDVYPSHVVDQVAREISDGEGPLFSLGSIGRFLIQESRHSDRTDRGWA
jgi:hypothetical protein